MLCVRVVGCEPNKILVPSEYSPSMTKKFIWSQGTCKNLDGSFECECANGYRGDGQNCDNIDECAERTHDCAKGHHVKPLFLRRICDVVRELKALSTSIGGAQ